MVWVNARIISLIITMSVLKPEAPPILCKGSEKQAQGKGKSRFFLQMGGAEWLSRKPGMTCLQIVSMAERIMYKYTAAGTDFAYLCRNGGPQPRGIFRFWRPSTERFGLFRAVLALLSASARMPFSVFGAR